MIDEHIRAFAALITNLTVYVDSEPPNDPAYPYVVVYGNQGDAAEASMAGDSSWRTWTIHTVCVGQTQQQARMAADRVDAVLDQRPVVTGRSCGLVSKVASQQVRPETDVQPSTFTAADVWSFMSVPA